MKTVLCLLLLALAVPVAAQTVSLSALEAEKNAAQAALLTDRSPEAKARYEAATLAWGKAINAALAANDPALAEIQANLAAARAIAAEMQEKERATFAPASYFVGAGVGLSRAFDPLATGWMAAGMCFKSGTCPYTEFDNITGVTTTMQGGVMQRLAKSGNLTLYALGQIGGATTDGALTAVFSGGFLMNYSRPKWNGLGIVMPVKAVKVGGTNVNLTIAWGCSKTF